MPLGAAQEIAKRQKQNKTKNLEGINPHHAYTQIKLMPLGFPFLFYENYLIYNQIKKKTLHGPDLSVHECLMKIVELVL